MNLYDFYQQKLEYGLEAIAYDKELAKHIQEILIWHKLLAPPADGMFDPISASALREFQELMKCNEEGFLGPDTAKKLIETHPRDLKELRQREFKPGNDLAGRIIKYMLKKGYHVDRRTGEYNIIYVEGMNTDGTLNSDQSNQFNDLRLVIEIVGGIPKIIDSWEATTEPGYFYTRNPISPYARKNGAARIKFGQYKAWKIGTHGQADTHEALIQDANITVHRDWNKDMIRTGDKLDTGLFGINQHHGFDYFRNDISNASAGCLVGRTRKGHREFMKLIKQDSRYQSNSNYKFLTTIIAGDDLEKQQFSNEEQTFNWNNFVQVLASTDIEVEDLKVAQLAQAILESGRGTSKLFKLHGNPFGMKYRPGMSQIASPIEYDASDETDTYCKFTTLSDAV